MLGKGWTPQHARGVSPPASNLSLAVSLPPVLIPLPPLPPPLPPVPVPLPPVLVPLPRVLSPIGHLACPPAVRLLHLPRVLASPLAAAKQESKRRAEERSHQLTRDARRAVDERTKREANEHKAAADKVVAWTVKRRVGRGAEAAPPQPLAQRPERTQVRHGLPISPHVSTFHDVRRPSHRRDHLQVDRTRSLNALARLWGQRRRERGQVRYGLLPCLPTSPPSMTFTDLLIDAISPYLRIS